MTEKNDSFLEMAVAVRETGTPAPLIHAARDPLHATAHGPGAAAPDPLVVPGLVAATGSSPLCLVVEVLPAAAG